MNAFGDLTPNQRRRLNESDTIRKAMTVEITNELLNSIFDLVPNDLVRRNVATRLLNTAGLIPVEPDPVQLAKRAAFEAMREALAGWMKGAEENHHACEHRGESEPCWRSFEVGDIATMIDDAERSVG